MGAAILPQNFLLIIAALGLLGGCVAIFIGRRGVRVGDHPICHRCGFDLVGLPVGGAVCSECGADLKKRRAVLIGHHRKRWAHLLLGLFVVVVCVIFLGRRGADALQEVNWYRLSPNWVLIRETYSSNSQTRDSALEELAHRTGAGELDGADLGPLLDRALQIQADEKVPWVEGWGQIIEAARASKRLSDDKWIAYAQHAISLQLDLRPRVRRGDLLIAELSHPPARVGGITGGFPATIKMGSPMTGAQWAIDTRLDGPRFYFSFGSFRQSELLGLSVSASDLKDGPQTTQFPISVLVYEPTDQMPPKLLFTQNLQLNGKWTLIPASQPSVALVVDPKLRAAVRASILTRQTWLERFSDPGLAKKRAILSFESYPPIDCAFDVILRSGGREWKAGEITATNGIAGKSELVDVPRDHVDVILRPNAALAAESTTMSRIWGEEVAIPNVKVVDDQK